MAEYVRKDGIVLRYDGLAQIDPRDFVGVAKYFLDQIMALPAANVAPVRHAHYDGPFCSCCGYPMATDCYGGCMDENKYCYHCGAKMDGGADRD